MVTTTVNDWPGDTVNPFCSPKVTARRRSKFGLGPTPDDFAAQVAAGRVTGHHGFAQSLATVAHGPGIQVDEYEVAPVRAALITSCDRAGGHVTLRGGTVAVVHHAARALSEGRAVIDLSVHFGFLEPG